jgi:hypothetical protein
VRIAPFWANFNTNTLSSDNVYVSTTSTSVTFVWQGHANVGGGAVNFSATLNKDGSFSFNYGAGNAALSPVIGVSAGANHVFVLSNSNGNANVQVFTPQPGLTYFDMGAYEFEGNSSDTTPPTVVSVGNLPANNGTTGLAFTSIPVQLSEPLDLLSATSPVNYSLIKADVNGLFTTAGATVIPVVPVYTLGSTTVTLTLPNGVLAPGSYQLTLSGTRAIFDQSGNALAGDGSDAGTNYVQTFTIDRTADQPPTAIAQSATVAENGSIQIVLSATNPQGGPLVYTVTASPAAGMASAIVNGNTLTYMPNANSFGSDAFTFRVTDNQGGYSQAVVSLTVTPVNQAPTANAQTVTVTHDTQTAIVLGGSDAETPAGQFVYTITTAPQHGTLLAGQGGADVFVYTPDAGYLGSDSFAFTVTDSGNPAGNTGNQRTSAPATVTLHVIDPAPAGVADAYSTRAGVPLTVSAAQGVLANDTDSVGDTLTASIGTTTAHGTLTLSSDGSFIYTPNAGYIGTDTFTYLPHGAYVAGSATTVSITVTAGASSPPPPPPPSFGGLAPHAPALPGAASLPFVATSSVTHLPDIAAASSGAMLALEATFKTTHPVGAPAIVMALDVATPSVAAPAPTLPSPQAGAAAMPPAPSPTADAARLIAVANPIVLPAFTTAGDETSSLILPALPEISRLPHAASAAVKRLSETHTAHHIFVDPVTGATINSALPVSHFRSADQGWLLLDSAIGQGTETMKPIIRWDSRPA